MTRASCIGILKPANVLLTADGIVKIADFGLAKHGDAGMTTSGEVMGTPSYMAPEQAKGDLKAIGPARRVCVGGDLCTSSWTGRPPFRGASSHDTLRLVMESEPVWPSRLQPKVPRRSGKPFA